MLHLWLFHKEKDNIFGYAIFTLIFLYLKDFFCHFHEFFAFSTNFREFSDSVLVVACIRAGISLVPVDCATAVEPSFDTADADFLILLTSTP